MGAFLKFLIFLKISELCQKHALSRNLLEKLGEVFKNNFLTAMQDLKRRLKVGTAKNRCHTISEPSLESLFIVASMLVGVLCLVYIMFCNAILVLSSFAIISPRKRDLVALLQLCSRCRIAVSVLFLFILVPLSWST